MYGSWSAWSFCDRSRRVGAGPERGPGGCELDCSGYVEFAQQRVKKERLGVVCCREVEPLGERQVIRLLSVSFLLFKNSFCCEESTTIMNGIHRTIKPIKNPKDSTKAK